MSAKTIACTLFIVASFVVSSTLSLAGAAQPAKSRVLIHYLPSAQPVHLDRERLQVFVAKPDPALSEEDATRLAEGLFSYTQATFSRDYDAAEKRQAHLLFRDPKDPSANLDVDLQTRELRFNKGLAPYKKEEDTGQLPTDEDAARLALAHLDKLSMLPPRDELVLAHVGGMNMGVHRSDGSTSLYRKLIVVRYDRTLAGLPVFGQSRVVLRLAENGSLVGLTRRWMPVAGESVRPEELLSDKAIAQAIRDQLLADGRSARSIVVKRMDLVLYDHGGGVIEPAIRILASMHYEDKVVNSRIVGEVRRLDVPYDTFVPVLKHHRTRYPFERDAEATRRIKSDQPPRMQEQEEPRIEGRS